MTSVLLRRREASVRWACSVVSWCWAGRDRREEARRSVAPLIRTEPDRLSSAQLSEPHKAQGPGLLQRNQLLPQLTCCVILAGREGAPQTPRTFPSEHRSSLRAIGTGLVQKAQHLAWLFFFKPATKRGFCKLSYALDTP